MFDEESAALQTLEDEIARSQVLIRQVSNGYRFRLDGSSTIRFLHPPENSLFGGGNEGSIVVLIEHDGFRILLPGDLEGDGLEHLLIQPEIDCDIVMAPHHGSLQDEPGRFVDWSLAECTVISGRFEADAESVLEFYRQRSRSVFHTGRDGAVSCVIADDAWQITSYRGKATEKFPKLE
jgi:competence protein ComEC